MNITTFNTIKIKLETLSSTELIQQLEYNSSTKAIKIIAAFKSHTTIHSWLTCGYYDFKYTTESLYKRLAKILKISNQEISNELKEHKLYKAELDKFKNSYIFVNTNFKRTT